MKTTKHLGLLVSGPMFGLSHKQSLTYILTFASIIIFFLNNIKAKLYCDSMID
jgi:hypothetical protein